jgi:lysophospholipase L1-like esterase
MMKYKLLFPFIILFLINSSALFAQKRNLHVIYIGDSITQGAGLGDGATQAPPVIASTYLQKQAGIGAVDFSNQGHSGFTTIDFLPGGASFTQVEQAANTFKDDPGLLIFTIMLGTNDSAIKGPNGAPVAPDAYYKNLKAIIDRLIKDYPNCKVIIQLPIWYSPNTYNGAQYLQEGLNRLQAYFPQIKRLVKTYRHQLFLGDTKAFSYFKNSYLVNFQAEEGHQGTFYLHPNQVGAEALGIFWATAIYKAIGGK